MTADLTPAEVARLVERLRVQARSWRRDDAHKARETDAEADVADEAADALTRLAAERGSLAAENAEQAATIAERDRRIARLEKLLEWRRTAPDRDRAEAKLRVELDALHHDIAEFCAASLGGGDGAG